MAAKTPRRVIEGSVAAQADGAAIAINNPDAAGRCAGIQPQLCAAADCRRATSGRLRLQRLRL